MKMKKRVVLILLFVSLLFGSPLPAHATSSSVSAPTADVMVCSPLYKGPSSGIVTHCASDPFNPATMTVAMLKAATFTISGFQPGGHHLLRLIVYGVGPEHGTQLAIWQGYVMGNQSWSFRTLVSKQVDGFGWPLYAFMVSVDGWPQFQFTLFTKS